MNKLLITALLTISATAHAKSIGQIDMECKSTVTTSTETKTQTLTVYENDGKYSFIASISHTNTGEIYQHNDYFKAGDFDTPVPAGEENPVRVLDSKDVHIPPACAGTDSLVDDEENVTLTFKRNECTYSY